MADRTCLHCGGTFTQTGPGAPRSWCYSCLPAYGDMSRTAYHRRAAALHAFKVDGLHIYCCGAERPSKPKAFRWKAGKMHGPLPLCDFCRSALVTKWHARICSDPECRRLKVNENNARWRSSTDKGRACHKRHSHGHSRRRINRIGKRDGWVCHLCGKRVNKALGFPHPMSASVDHLIPRSLQGHDDDANLALAHFRCNVVKGNRPVGEQLRLIG